MDAFDPRDGVPYDDASVLAVFPDVRTLIAACGDSAEDGKPLPDEEPQYFVAQVPETPVFILYAVYEQAKVVLIISIRDYKPHVN